MSRRLPFDSVEKIDGVDLAMYIRTGRRDENALGIFCATIDYRTPFSDSDVN
jgi:hypothetical protein